MSAFICSDLHFSAIAYACAPTPDHVQAFADRLKRINIESVNHRYGEKTRVTKCRLAPLPEVAAFSTSDVIRLAACWDYQSCEKGGSLDHALMAAFLQSCHTAEQRTTADATSRIWSV